MIEQQLEVYTMASIRIQQSSLAHPGHITEDDIVFLQDAVLQASDEIKLSPFFSSKLERHDSGLLFVSIAFVFGGLAGGILSEVGKDIYKWVKIKLIPLMRKKNDLTHVSTTAYPYKDPEWEVQIEA